MSLLTPTTDSLQGRPRRTRPAVSLVEREAKRLGLRLISRGLLSIRRRRAGKRWTYLADDDRIIRDTATIRRLDRLAVPPAYRGVLYAEDCDAHLQAVGRDAAGRLQYRYHPKWERVRELRKARRLARLAAALPQVNQKLGYHLGADEPKLSFTCAAVIELVAHTAIRPGNEAYARLRGTRGAATLLKSNVTVEDTTVTLTFRAKGGKNVIKQVDCARLAKAIVRLPNCRGGGYSSTAATPARSEQSRPGRSTRFCERWRG